MNAWAADLLSNSPAQRIAWALVHFLWQGAAVALLLAATLQLVRGRSAQVRWVLCCAALALMAALPVVTACVVSVDAPVPVVAGPVVQALPTPEAFTLPPGETAPEPAPAVVGEEPASPAAGPVRVPDGAAEAVPAAPWGLRLEQFVRPALPWSFAAWLVGMVVMSVWHLGGWLLLERTKRHGVRFADGAIRDVFDRLLRRLRVSRPVRLLQSARVAVPTVAGWLRPVVLLPASALSGLSLEQIEAILAHELAHIRRYDCLVRLIQAVVETLLFYHPAVWWVSGRIRQESEHCCDDAAVAVCGSRVTYARALAGMEDFRAVPAAAAAASGGRLLDRIRRIVGLRRDRAGGDIRRWGAAASAVFVLVGLTVAAAIFYGCQAPTATLESRKAADADDWGPPGTDGLRIRLVIPKLKGEAVPTLNAERYFDAPPGIRKPEVRLEIDNKGDRSIRLAEQNVTGGRMNINDEWLIGLSLEMQDGDGVRRLTRTDDQDDFWSAIGNMPSPRQIKPGETVAFGLRLNKLGDERGRPLSSLHGPRRLRPVLEIRDGRFGLWHGTARGKFVPVVIQRKRDAAWGKPVEGVQSRLRRGVFRNGEQWLSFDLRNDSSNLSVKLSPGGVPREILVDNVPYRWSGRIAGGLPVCKPGQRVTGAEFKLDKNWTAIKSVSGPKTLELKPGKHTVQAIVYAGAEDAAPRGPIVRVLSNPVVIEVISAKEIAARPKRLKSQKNAFELRLAYHGPKDNPGQSGVKDPFRSLIIHTTLVDIHPLWGWSAISISEDQAARIIDHLQAEGSLADALPFTDRPPPALDGPAYTLTIKGPDKLLLYKPLGWGLRVLDHFEGLRTVLEGDAAKGMDKLLAALGPQRKQWEAVAKWGQAVEGVQCRVRAEKPTWPQGTVPKLFADLRNQGKRNLRIALEHESWEIEIDGKWHKMVGGFTGDRNYLPLGPGGQQQNLEVWILADGNLGRKLGALEPGKHTLRVARLLNSSRRPGEDVLRLVSNPVVIEVISAKEIAARPKRLKSQKNAFELRLAYHGPRDKPNQAGVDPIRSLILHTTLIDYDLLHSWSAVSISEDQAARIIDHLQAEGSLADVLPFTDERPPPPLDGPAYSLTVKGPDKLVLYKPLGWGLRVLDFLEGLRTVLEGDPAKALDQLMVVLGPQRKQWEAVAKWGQAVEGVQVRLRAKQSKWRQGLTPRLLADVRNLGKRNLLVYGAVDFWTSSELEVDGRWYRRPLPKHSYRPPMMRLVPGRQCDKIYVMPDRWWQLRASPSQDAGGPEAAKREPERLGRLAPGKHRIRVAVTMPVSGKRPGDHVRAISNPAEIEIVAAPETKVARPVDADSWGKPLDGLRCRWIPSAKPVPVGTKPMISMEVENTSDKPILWNCASEITLGLSKSAPPSGGHMPKFSVRLGQHARLATAGEVREQFGIGWPDRKDEDPAPDYYRLEPKGRVVLTAECPWEVDKVGPAKIYGVVYRVHPITDVISPAEKKVRCPPLILSVVGVATADPWGPKGTGGLQIRLVVPKLKGEAVPTLSAERYFDAPPGIRKPEVRLEIHNKGDRPIRLAKQNTTGGRRNMVGDWLIGLSLEMRDGDAVRRLTRTDDQDDYWSAIGNMPSSREIKQGETVAFGLQLNKLADERGRPLSSLHGPRRLRPVLEIRDARFGLWHGTARGKFVPVVIQGKGAAATADTTAADENDRDKMKEKPAWGKPVEGVQSRLRRGVFRDGHQWLSFDLRNDSRNLSVHLGPGGGPCMIRVDNVPYDFPRAGSICKPGQAVTGVQFKLDKRWSTAHWLDKNGRLRILSGGQRTLEELKPGKHTVQVTVHAVGKEKDNGGREEVYVTSNPVEIEIPPSAAAGSKAARGKSVERKWSDATIDFTLRVIEGTAQTPFVAEIVITNRTDETQSVPTPHLMPLCGDTNKNNIRVSDKDKNPLKMRGIHGDGPSRSSTKLPPKSSMTWRFSLEEWFADMADPGTYQVEPWYFSDDTRWSSWVGRVKMQPLTVVRKESLGAAWGKPVDGVRLRLAMATVRWERPDRLLAALFLRYDAKNEGSRILSLSQHPLRHQVEVDGQWYEWANPRRVARESGKPFNSGFGVSLDFKPGSHHKDKRVIVTKNWRSIPKGEEREYAERQYSGWDAVNAKDDYGKELVLTPGKYRVRIAVVCPSAKAASSRGIVRAVSGAMEVEVVAAPKIKVPRPVDADKAPADDSAAERVVAYRKGFPSETVPEPGPMYLDLDTGAYVKFKVLPTSKMVRSAGVDVYYEREAGGPGMRLTTSNLQLQPLSDKTGWDSSPKHVWRALMVASPCSLTYPGRSTLAFKTRDGGLGILQILGFTKDRRGIRIRYKMLPRPKAGRSATPRATQPAAGSKPEIVEVSVLAARIPHLWVDGKKVKVDLTLRVVRTTSRWVVRTTSRGVVTTTLRGNIESNWFLRRSGRDEDEHIGTDLGAMSQVRQLKPSPDGKFLAVLSVGEGHPIVEVIDLPLLVKRKTYKVLHEIDPFPGGVTIDRWAQDSLLLRSDMLLTHRGKNGRFHPVLCMERTQTYSLSVTDGVIKALSADAREPVAYFIGQLSSKDATERGSAIMALTFLKARAAIPALRKVLAVEKDESIREDAAEALKRIRASKPTTRPATQPARQVGAQGT